MQTQLIANSLVVFVASPALADCYIAQDPTTKQCKIVDAKRRWHNHADGREILV